jgi:phospholipid/cholesterol/gamma-HCH transport system substrate-binding protein
MDNLETGTATIDKVAAKAETSMDKFDRVMTKIDKGEGTLGALITDSSIHDQLKTMLGGSQRKSQVKDMLRHSLEK